MHRVITVSLRNNAYQIEEDGYNALQDYLRRAKTGLKDNPDVDEILRDLEQSIAEKCVRFLGPAKNVVSSQEIEQILEEVGPVVVDSESPAEGSQVIEDENEARHDRGANERTSSRRLRRISNGSVIGGVCTGLADYFGIDVIIVRLIFVGLVIASGFGLVAYVVMMLAIPYDDSQEAVAVERAPTFWIALLALLAAVVLLYGPLMSSGIDADFGRPSPFFHPAFGVIELIVIGFLAMFLFLIDRSARRPITIILAVTIILVGLLRFGTRSAHMSAIGAPELFMIAIVGCIALAVVGALRSRMR